MDRIQLEESCHECGGKLDDGYQEQTIHGPGGVRWEAEDTETETVYFCSTCISERERDHYDEGYYAAGDQAYDLSVEESLEF